MSVLSFAGRVIGVVPRVIDVIRALVRTRTRPLADPLGESEAARTLRLEDERRAQAVQSADSRVRSEGGDGGGDGN